MRHDRLIGSAVECVGALRETIGPDVDIGIELHRRLSPADAIVLAAELEQFRPMYYEDPIVQESTASYGDIARQIRLPMATGERLQTLYESGSFWCAAAPATLGSTSGWPAGSRRPRRSQRWPSRSTPRDPPRCAVHRGRGSGDPT